MPRKTCCGEFLLLALDYFVAWLSSTEPSTIPIHQSPSPRSSQTEVIWQQYRETYQKTQISTQLPAPVQPRRLISAPPHRPIVNAASVAPKPYSQGTSFSKGKPAKVSRSRKAGLEFPVGRISRYMKQGEYAERIGAGAPIYIAAVLEYLAAEILELAGDVTKDKRGVRIIPRHIQLAVRNDEELTRLLGNIVVASGGSL